MRRPQNLKKKSPSLFWRLLSNVKISGRFCQMWPFQKTWTITHFKCDFKKALTQLWYIRWDFYLGSCWVLNLDQKHLLTCVRPDVWSFVIVLLLPFGGPFIADQYNKSCVFGPRGRNLKWRFCLSIHSGQFHLTNYFLLATKVVLAFLTLFLSQSIFPFNCEFRWNNEMHA